MQAFLSSGIKNVTMDEIARRLSISKRTLYQLFADKEDLLLTSLMLYNERGEEQFQAVARESDNVLFILLSRFSLHLKDIKNVPSEFLQEMAKYPKVRRYAQRRLKSQEENTMVFLQKGVEQGYFRSDINYRLVYRYLIEGSRFTLHSSVFHTYAPHEIFIDTLLVFMRGCCTPKGMELVDEFVKSYKVGAQLAAL